MHEPGGGTPGYDPTEEETTQVRQLDTEPAEQADEAEPSDETAVPEQSYGDRYIEERFQPHEELPEAPEPVLAAAMDRWCQNKGVDRSYADNWYHSLRTGTLSLLVTYSPDMYARNFSELAQEIEAGDENQLYKNMVSHMLGNYSVQYGHMPSKFRQLIDEQYDGQASKAILREALDRAALNRPVIEQEHRRIDEIKEKYYSLPDELLYTYSSSLYALRRKSRELTDLDSQSTWIEESTILAREAEKMTSLPYTAFLAIATIRNDELAERIADGLNTNDAVLFRVFRSERLEFATSDDIKNALSSADEKFAVYLPTKNEPEDNQ